MSSLRYVRKIVSDFEEIQQKVNEINGIQSGTVRIGTFSSVAINWLPAGGAFDVISLKKDEYKAVLPVDHPLAEKNYWIMKI